MTTVDDAKAAVELGADILGLNFFAQSPRYVTIAHALEIAAQTPCTAGVFVNEAAAKVSQVAAEVGLDWVQLHGDEPAELLADIDDELPIIRARTLSSQGLVGVLDDLLACERAGRLPDAVLIDATVPGQYGGTGKTVDWAALDDHNELLREIPLILAGGLTPENVCQAITTVMPAAVDTASGVEASPGVKDVEKMRSFMQAAKLSFGTAERRVE